MGPGSRVWWKISPRSGWGYLTMVPAVVIKIKETEHALMARIRCVFRKPSGYEAVERMVKMDSIRDRHEDCDHERLLR